MNYRELISHCGVDCFNCQIYKDNIKPELAEAIAAKRGIDPADVVCGGCKITGCSLFGDRKCECVECVKAKGIEFCFECDEFPCKILHPCAWHAVDYPQNQKVYNLMRMKKIGVEKWAQEEATASRERYANGKIIIGSGPKLMEEIPEPLRKFFQD